MEINIGIKETERKAIAGELSKLLADSYTLYLKTHNFHWNVTGPMFQTLHLLFEQQYKELAVAVDDIAETIRALGIYAPATYTEFIRMTSIAESQGTLSSQQMIRQLIEGHEAVIKTARHAYIEAGKAHDEVSSDLLTHRIQFHEKAAWMLRSLLEN